ncbi:MAG: N-acetylmuramoyl-L-alanine amidase [Paracoccaceae bacterium]|jgi:N-acetylmuramoyl-L-alanine amidase
MVNITQIASPNFTTRRHGRGPDMVVLHHTAMASCGAAVQRLRDPETEVSAHYVISENGNVFQLVDEDMRAWHAGAGSWGNVTDVNSHSIGIELANAGPLAGFPPFPEPQMAASEDLLKAILTRHSINPERVIAHSDMAPARKFDPGAKFDWRRLAVGGLSVWPDPDPVEGADFVKDAAQFGYDTSHPEDVLLAAFRLRFRQGTTGPLNDLDRAIIRDLARRFPVDQSSSTP